MFDVRYSITYEEAREKLDEINIALEKDPFNADLWHQKGLLRFAAIANSTGINRYEVYTEDKLANIARPFFLKSYYLGKRDWEICYELSYSYFVCSNFRQALIYLEPVINSDIFLSDRVYDSHEETGYSQMLYMAIHCYSALGDLDKLEKCLERARRRGKNYSELYIKAALQVDSDFLEQHFITNGHICMENLHELLNSLPHGNTLQELYRHNAMKMCMELEELLIFDSEEFEQGLQDFEITYGIHMVTKIFRIYQNLENKTWDILFYTGNCLYGSMKQALQELQELSQMSIQSPFYQIEDFFALNLPEERISWNKKWHRIYFSLILYEHSWYGVPFFHLGKFYDLFEDLDLSMFFYKLSYKYFKLYDNSAACAYALGYLSRTLRRHGKTGQAHRCLEYMEQWMDDVKDPKLIKSYEDMRTSKTSVNDLDVYLRSYHSQYSQNVYTISVDDTIDMHFGYVNFMDLYDVLLIEWENRISSRERMDWRSAGNQQLHKAYVIGKHLIKISLEIKCYDYAIMHLEEYRSFDLKRRILFLKNIRMIKNPLLHTQLETIDRQFRRLSAIENPSDVELFTDISELDKKVERLMRQKASDSIYIDEAVLCQKSVGSAYATIENSANILLLDFFYDEENSWCFAVQDNTIKQVIAFVGTGKRKITEWIDLLIEADLYNVFCTLPDGKAVINKTKIANFNRLMYELDQCFYYKIKEAIASLNPKEIVLIPFQAMNGLPLNILGYTEGKPLGLGRSVSFSPSERIYKELEDEMLSPISNAVFFSDPLRTDSDFEELPFSLEESLFAMKILSSHEIKTISYTGGEASNENAYTVFPEAQLLHIGCHSFFNSAEPEKSGIILSNVKSDIEGKEIAEDILTLQDLWVKINLQNCQFMNLSSCYSGMVEWNHLETDEFIGLINGCLYAGVHYGPG